jgi:hypothetical protein
LNARRAALAVALLSLLALAAVRGGSGGPPLYDGICTSAPYPMFGANPGPTSVSQTYTVSELAMSQVLSTGESVPLAQMIFAEGSFTPAIGASTVTVSITPVKPPAVKPADGTVDGNVYAFSAGSGGQEMSLAPGHPATIVLSAPSSGAAQPGIERFDGSRWIPAPKTFQSGCGTTFQVASPTLGLFALVGKGATVSPGGGGQGEGAVTLIVTAAGFVVLALFLGAVRVARRRL